MYRVFINQSKHLKRHFPDVFIQKLEHVYILVHVDM